MEGSFSNLFVMCNIIIISLLKLLHRLPLLKRNTSAVKATFIAVTHDRLRKQRKGELDSKIQLLVLTNHPRFGHVK